MSEAVLLPASRHSDEPWRVNLGRVNDTELRGDRPGWWWTGKLPVFGVCPGVDENGVLSSLPLPNFQTATKQDLLDYFDNSWALTEVLFSSLATEESFYRPPYHNLRHPMIFYYCHPASLYVNKLRVSGALSGPLNAYYEHLFETGVDEMSWDDLSKNDKIWPSIREANDYRRLVYQTTSQAIADLPELDAAQIVTYQHPAWAILMGFEHERIHLETSSVLIRELPLEHLQRPPQWPPNHPSIASELCGQYPPQVGTHYPANAMIAMPESNVALGKPREWPTFGWDNEYGSEVRYVRPFQASRHLISNGEFYEFVMAGGYREQRYWSEDGWNWRHFRNAKWPTFWVSDGPAGLYRFKLRLCFEAVDMPWDWPADVNWYEAKAYCAWRTEQEGGATPYRLQTEAEYAALRDRTTIDPVMSASGHEMMARYGSNLNLAFSSESPVNAGKPTATGFYDVAGNVWQWCEDDFHPLPQSTVDPHYEDFSTPCYDGRQKMMLGGSFASTGDEASIWARFHFRPHFFQHVGFRLVVSDDGNPSCDAVLIQSREKKQEAYENERALNEYMLLHYGDSADQMPYAFGPQGATDFPARCAGLLIRAAGQQELLGGKVLDLGCAVGRTTFELARYFEQCIGVDLSRTFIDAANELKERGCRTYWRKDEGNLGEAKEAVISPAIARDRVTFRQGDACALSPDLGPFDAVFLGNLLCRLPDPRACLSRLSELVKPGGLLLITSPYSWLEEFTPASSWLGGFEREGHPVKGIDTFHELLGDSFQLVEQTEIPLVIREHARKFQFIVAHATLWQRSPF